MKFIPLLFIIFISGLKADFNSAADAYEQGNYQQAYEEYLSMAKVGEKRSQFNIAVMYFNGQHVNKDINKAYAWMKLSVDSDSATQKMKELFASVKTVVKDQKKADQEYGKLSSLYSSETLLKTLYPSFVELNNENAYQAEPIKIAQPRFPRKAVQNGIQGWTKFSFDLDKNGIPRNIVLMESAPKEVFDKESARAIAKWQFKPAVDKEGNTIESQSMIYTLEFRLATKDGGLKLKERYVRSTLEKLKQEDPVAQFEVAFWKTKGLFPEVDVNPSELFFKSAQKGLPSAQYQIGKSLIYGKGCVQDKAKGIAWLTRAASNGQTEARELLASVNFERQDLESQQAGLDYLSNIEKLSPLTKIQLAKVLATSPYESISNPKKALDIVKKVKLREFPDEITLFEIKAAAYAKLGKFKKAINYQEDALDEAEDLGADTYGIIERLDSYKNKKVVAYF